MYQEIKLPNGARLLTEEEEEYPEYCRLLS